MALMMGDAPFGRNSSGTFNFDTGVLQAHTLYFEDCPKRVRALFGGEAVADSRAVKRLHETGLLPTYYFPEEDVRMDLLEKTDHTTHCPFKGDASYWAIKSGDRVAENVVWGYPEPLESSPPLAGYVAFYWDAMDAWMEEDEEVFAHPHDPYHRVDVLNSSRHVKVTVNGEVVAETDHPKLVFETSLPTRYYIPQEDVRTDLLVETDTKTECPYKGIASYFSVRTGGDLAEDVAWSYPEPLPESEKLPGTLCFFGEGVETEVDGEKL
ncbi:MAG: DUF427 domain-containing protein [Rubrobacteraceae bacterium]